MIEPCRGAGNVLAWGDNVSAQSTVPNHPPPRNVIAVAGGSTHSLVLQSNNTLVSWGDNSQGEATFPSGLHGITAIATGNKFSLALQTNGIVAMWGSRTSVPAYLTNAIAISASMDNPMALTSDGTVVVWGNVPAPTDPITNIVAISAGGTHCLALRGDGQVVAWGDDTNEQSMVPDTLTNVVAVAAGNSNSLALESDGTVVAWGDNTWGQSTVPAGLHNVVAIAAGARHCLALEQDGTVVAWGDNSYSQTNVPANATSIVGIAAGDYHSLAIVGDGSPVITVQPVAQFDAATATLTFNVMAAGQAPLSYQWQEDGIDIPDGINPTLILTNFSTSGLPSFSVTISNALGVVVSDTVQLPPAWLSPSVTQQPQDASANCGDPASFQAAAIGTAPLNYQWQFNGTNIPDATNYVLNLPAVTSESAGEYSVIVSNASGYTNSEAATLTVIGEPPLIDSPLTAGGKQGVAFKYTITGAHNPSIFLADGLPAGLSVDSTNGLIQGTPLASGLFNVTLTAVNICDSASTNLALVITSSIPVITSKLTAAATEQAAFKYQIKASNLPIAFNAVDLPQGLAVDPATGIISGTPIYSGNYTIPITASNLWGVGSANLQLTIANAGIQGLSIVNVITNYLSPYLLDFTFSLRDNNDPTQGNALVVDPSLLKLTAYEDGQPVSTNETSVLIEPASSKVLKAYLVLDFTESVADGSGPVDSNGVPLAVDTEVAAAQSFVNQQPASTQMGVYEFHREDEGPQQVQSLTSDKTLLNNAIAGIWTNYVQSFPAGSRCWDALVAAINAVGASTNGDEEHYVIFCSDGSDTSSTNSIQDVINAASNATVQVYCVGFGSPIDTANLQSITSQTAGQYYEATDLAALATDFALIGKDLGGQYVLRWATLQRSTNSFMPSFDVTYQGITATSPPIPPPVVTGTNYVLDTNSVPPTTNAVPIYTTNYIIGPYVPSAFAGDVTVGSLRLVPDADVRPSTITLRATYVPRYIRQLHIHYHPNWPCNVLLDSTNAGEPLYGWTLSQTNDGDGGYWATLTSFDPGSLASSIPYASFGALLSFAFHDIISTNQAFSVFEIDNSIYTNTGDQSFTLDNTNDFITPYPTLPFGTPVPWLISYGITNAADWASDETNDLNGNGLMVWQDYVAGLDPTNSNSFFGIRTLAPTGTPGDYHITFPTALNRTYRIETSTDLVNWRILQDGIAGTGGDVTITDTANYSSHAYYRLAVY